MRETHSRQRLRIASIVAVSAVLAAAAGCQNQAGAQNYGASGSKQQPLKPIEKVDHCTRIGAVDAASAPRVLQLCEPLVGQEERRDYSNAKIAALYLNIGRAYTFTNPPRLTEARRILERAPTIRAGVVQPEVDNALAEVYLQIGGDENLDLALAKLGRNPDLKSVRRRVDILEKKSKLPSVNDVDLSRWQAEASAYQAAAAQGGNTPEAERERNLARAQYISASLRLGDYWLDRADKLSAEARENPAVRDSARAALRQAVAALAETQGPEIIARRGKAQLQLAGLDGPGQVTDFGCRAGQADRGGLAAAEATLLSISPTTPESNSLLGCAFQAQGKLDQAIRSFADAARSAATTTRAAGAGADDYTAAADYYVQLGNAQRDKAATANRPDDPSLSNAVSSYESALRIYETGLDGLSPADATARRLKIARTNFALGELKSLEGVTRDLAAANCYYLAALQQDASFAEAQLEYGKYFYRRAKSEGPNKSAAGQCPSGQSTSGDNLSLAIERLSRAGDVAVGSGNRAVQNESKLYLSRVWTEFGKKDDLTQARRLALEALTAAPGEWRYREQVCRVFVAIGGQGLRSQDARSACITFGETPEAYALEGLYYLRRAQPGTGGRPRLSPEAIEELANAKTQFQRGLNALEKEPPSARSQADRAAMRARLRIGRGTADYCALQKDLGDQDIAEAINEDRRSAELVLAEMDVYSVRSCDGSKVSR